MMLKLQRKMWGTRLRERSAIDIYIVTECVDGDSH